MGSGVTPPLSPPENVGPLKKPPAEPVLSRVEGLRLIRSLLARRSARASHLALFERPKNLTILSQLNTGTLQLRGVALVNMVKPHDQLVPVSFNHY